MFRKLREGVKSHIVWAIQVLRVAFMSGKVLLDAAQGRGGMAVPPEGSVPTASSSRLGIHSWWMMGILNDGEPQRVEAQVVGGPESGNPVSRRLRVLGLPPPWVSQSLGLPFLVIRSIILSLL